MGGSLGASTGAPPETPTGRLAFSDMCGKLASSLYGKLDGLTYKKLAPHREFA